MDECELSHKTSLSLLPERSGAGSPKLHPTLIVPLGKGTRVHPLNQGANPIGRLGPATNSKNRARGLAWHVITRAVSNSPSLNRKGKCTVPRAQRGSSGGGSCTWRGDGWSDGWKRGSCTRSVCVTAACSRLTHAPSITYRSTCVRGPCLS